MTDYTILSGQVLSTQSIELGADTLYGLFVPAAWTSANITFMVSEDNVNFFDLYDEAGNLITAVVGSGGKAVSLPMEIASFRFLKIKSTASQAVTRQLGFARK